MAANMVSLKESQSISTPERLTELQPSLVSKVKVIVRVRPFLPQEISARNGSSVSCVSVLHSDSETSGEVTVHLKDYETSRNECYKLDGFFGDEDNNVNEIFHKEVSHLIPGVFRGYNATVFAYGATGSGKTYTMQGSAATPGVMPLAMSSILSVCQRTGSTVAISYYEIYMDKCYDLLELKNKEVAVLDDKDGQIHLKGLAKVVVNSMEDFYEVFSAAVQRRKVAHTSLNDVSSRSHGVLVISVSTPCHEISGNFITGKLNLIDLAGNEDNRRTCNEGIRLQESAKINQSLFALSNVIYALNNNQSRVPYRESKLTRVLQDSLGGTSCALMVACLNPGEYQESVHTVSLAARSRHISNFLPSANKACTPTIKVNMEAKLRAWLESKGKTKSAQRPKVFASPFTSKTPKSISSIKRDQMCPSSAKSKLFGNKVFSDLKQRATDVSCRDLFTDAHCFISALEALDNFDGGNTEKKIDVSGERGEESNNCKSDEQEVKEEKNGSVESINPTGSSTATEKTNSFQSPHRKALSPINTNIQTDSVSRMEKGHVYLSDSVNSSGYTFQMPGTPLEKFNVLSSNLKSSLAQEYIEFLNNASREELLEIRGIGQKLADYIIELREDSPLKSLNDLEKLGLSSKQVQNLFGKAAKVLFE